MFKISWALIPQIYASTFIHHAQRVLLESTYECSFKQKVRTYRCSMKDVEIELEKQTNKTNKTNQEAPMSSKENIPKSKIYIPNAGACEFDAN